MSLTKVTSDGIKDGTITSADIDSSAAIAGSKIDPSFTSDITITDVNPALLLVDSNNNSDYELGNQDGTFRLRDSTNTTNRMTLSSTGQFDFEGNVDCNAGLDVTGNITVTGTVDGVDVAALSSTVSGKLSNVVDDTTPQLGGNLDCNNKVVTLNDSTGSDNNRFKIGNAGDLQIYHDGNSRIINTSGALKLLSDVTEINNADNNEALALFTANGSVELYHDNTKRFETYSDGIIVGDGDGGVGLTLNDGQGNANVTFNHASGTPDRNGNAGRISVNVDGSTNVSMKFELKSGVTSGSTISTTEILDLREDQILAKKPLVGTTSARAWVNFAAGNAGIRDDYNVSSVTDHGTGDYTVNFTTSMQDNDYAWFVSGGRGSAGGAIVATQDTTNMASSSFRFTTRNLSNNKENFAHVCAGFFR